MSEEYLRGLEVRGAAPATLRKKRSLLRILMPLLGPNSVVYIDRKRLAYVLRWKVKRGRRDTVRDAVALTNAIIRYAIETYDGEWVNTCETMRADLRTPLRKGVRSVRSSREFGVLLRSVEGFKGSPSVRLGLLLLAHTLVEPGHLRLAKWEQIDLDAGLFRLPTSGEKSARFAALSDHALSLFSQLGGTSRERDWVLPSSVKRGHPISDMALIRALRSVAGEGRTFTPGSFRKSARKLLAIDGFSKAEADRLFVISEDEITLKAPALDDPLEAIFQRANDWSDRLERLSQATVDGGGIELTKSSRMVLAKAHAAEPRTGGN